MSVTVSDLKANLAAYLRKVSRGADIQIVHRGVPIARLIGMGAIETTKVAEQRRQRLIASGVLSPGQKIPVTALPLPLVVDVDMNAAIDNERADRV